MNRTIMGWLLVVSAFGAGTLACGASPDEGESMLDDMEVGQVALAVTTVPTGLTCIRVTLHDMGMGVANWFPFATFDFPISGSDWTATIKAGEFTRGTIEVWASGYDVACSSIGGPAPSWVADPVRVTVTPGAPAPATLNFRQNHGIVASANFAPSVADVAVGASTTGLRLVDGTVKFISSTVWPVSSLTGVVQLAVGTDHACARKSDGTLWCWGDDTFGQLGNGGANQGSATPVQVSNISDATFIAAGKQTTCASTRFSTYCWGLNANGALGDGTTTNRGAPQATNLMGGSSAISTSSLFTCAVKNDGTPFCWGANAGGQLGNGGTANSLNPVQVSSLRGITNISVGGGHACAVNSANLGYCWGFNTFGQLGNGTMTNSSFPLQVVSDAAEIAAGHSHTCSRKTTGEAYCWGSNTAGSVGDGSGINRLWPVPVIFPREDISLPSNNVAAIRTNGNGHTSCALLLDVSVYCWGDNANSQLGDRTHINRFTPVPMQL